MDREGDAVTLPCLLLRADASSEIGSGHVGRCLTLAGTFHEHHGGTAVFCANGLTASMAQRITGAGHRLTMLPGPTGGAEDLATVRALVGETPPMAIVIDGYHFHDDYRAGLADLGIAVLSFDDTGGETAFADVVVNTSPAAAVADYAGLAPDVVRLLGPDYALVSPDIMKLRDIDGPRGGILVNFGGSDPHGMTFPVTEAIGQILPGVPLHAVVGGGTANAEAVAAKLARLPDVRVSRDLPSLGPAISEARLVVTAAGTSIFEIAALGRPMVVAIVTDNQARLGSVSWAEVVDVRTASSAAALLAARATELWRDEGRAEHMAAEAATVVDGQGAGRILDALMERTGFRSR